MSFSSLSELKKSRGGFENLVKEVEKMNKASTSSSDDDRYWQPEVDKAGNGYAVIRFLAPPQGEDLPFARLWTHGFQNKVTGKWYIENSLTTLGQPDPVAEYNTRLWNSGRESDKDIAREQKRKLNYISNILVVKDPAHPENEGKVKLFKYGKKIFDKIVDISNPQFEDEDPINPFDFWKGANFKLKIRKVEGYRNYDKSEFDSPSPIADSDEEIEKIWKQQYSLKELVDPKYFKSYEELSRKLQMVLSNGAIAQQAQNVEEGDFETKPTPKPVAQTKVAREEVNFDDDDESLSYFSSLANDD